MRSELSASSPSSAVLLGFLFRCRLTYSGEVIGKPMMPILGRHL
jgi:hypothetical protein